MFRFLHLADVHLDTPFASRSARVRDLLADSLRRSLENAVALAAQEKVDAVLIAGDLLDRAEPALGAELFLLRQLRKLSEAGIPVFYSTGNHDPLASRLGSRRIEWPRDVTLFAHGNPVQREVVGPDGAPLARITGAGHEGPEIGDNLASRFPAAAGPLPEVALLHAAVSGTSGLDPKEERYAPCSPRDLRGRGYDYWALGHVHKRGSPHSDPPAHYPGSIFGLDRTETGEKGVLLVEIERGAPPRVSFRATAPVRWMEIEIDASGAASVESLRNILHTQIISSCDPRKTLLTVRLGGSSPLKPDLEKKAETRALEEGLAEEIGLPHLSIRTEGLRGVVDWNRVRVGPLGAAIDLTAALREGREPLGGVAPSELAGLSPAASAEEREQYLRSLLAGAEEELVRRMWGDAP